MISSNEYLNLNQFKCIESIGKGSFGEVFLIEEKKTKKKYATKKFLEEINQSKQSTDEFIALYKEVKIMSALNHPTILRFIGFSPIDFQGNAHPNIITEYISNGSLRKILDLENQSLAPKEWDPTKKLICIYGIASGMEYLHRCNIIHRDLKPDNILMDDSLHPIITDFGLLKVVDDLTESLCIKSEYNNLKGTPIFSAPEVLAEYEYSKASDVYSFGMIVYQIITGQLPLIKFTTLYDLTKKVKSGERPEFTEDTPPIYVEFIQSCWSGLIEERPSFEEITQVLKSIDGFIAENVDKNEFFDYVEKIDNSKCSFDINNIDLHMYNFLSQENLIENENGEKEKIVENPEKKEKIKEKEKSDKKEKIIEKENPEKKEKIKEKEKSDKKEKIIEKENPEKKGKKKSDKKEKIVESENPEKKEKKKSDKKEKIVESENPEKKEKKKEKKKSDKKEKIAENENPEKEEKAKSGKKEKIVENDSSEKKEKKKEKKKSDKKEKIAEDNDYEKDEEIDDHKKISVVKKQPKKIVYPIEEIEKLDEECQKLAKDAENDPQKQFLIGKYLIEGISNFPQNTQLGIKYLRQSNKNSCFESAIYLGKLYIDGDFVPEDIDEAEEILNNVDDDQDDGDYFLLIGRIEEKKGEFKKAFKNMKKAAKLGNAEAMYRFGNMYLEGKGTEVDESKANQYFELAKKNGYIESSTQSTEVPENKNDFTQRKEMYLNRKNSLPPPLIQKVFDQRKESHRENTYSPSLVENIVNNDNESLSNSPKIHLNVTFIGDEDCGKHNLVYYLVTGHSPEDVPTTIENSSVLFDFQGEMIAINLYENDEDEESDIKSFNYTNTNIFVMVYSMVNKSTLENLIDKWNDDIKEYKSKACIILLGVDLEQISDDDQENENYVTQEEIKNAQKSINANNSITCSYVSDENIDEFKNKAIGSYMMKFYNPDDDLSDKTSNNDDLKILLVGNYDGGQYQLMQYIEKESYDSEEPINPVKKVEKSITIKGKKVKNLHFYSTPGDPNNNKIRYVAYHQSNVVILVFSLINSQSFSDLASIYMKEINQFTRDSAVVLVGVDLENWNDDSSDNSIVHKKQIEKFIKTNNILAFIKCSYINGENMNSFYEKIIDAADKKKKRKSSLSFRSSQKF